MLDSRNPQKEIYWIIQCSTIAGSASYVMNGYPDTQVTMLKNTLREAVKQGINWQGLYNSIYQQWHTRRPHFPTPEAMAVLMEQG